MWRSRARRPHGAYRSIRGMRQPSTTHLDAPRCMSGFMYSECGMTQEYENIHGNPKPRDLVFLSCICRTEYTVRTCALDYMYLGCPSK